MNIARSSCLVLAAILATHRPGDAANGEEPGPSAADVQAQTNPPERKVAGNVITSARDPKARIELPRSVRYVDADRWVLYDIADCELLAFFDVD